MELDNRRKKLKKVNKPRATLKPTASKPTIPNSQTKKKEFEITKDQLKKLNWSKNARTSSMVEKLNTWLKKYNMSNKNVICHFISQCMQECGCGYSITEKWGSVK